jgi:archaellum biogenesis ATPase FlaH
MQENLQSYGTRFQQKVIYLLLHDIKFITSIYDSLSEVYFELDTHIFLVKKIIEYYAKYHDVPTLDFFKVEFQELNVNYQKELVDEIKEIFALSDSKDFEYIDASFVKFCKQQAFKNALLKSIDHVESGDFSNILEIIRKANNVGENRDIGLSLFETDVNMVQNTLVRQTTGTPWDIINNITNGGIGTKELWIVVAPAGAGKSWLLCSLGTALLKAGKNVLHYTLELEEGSVLQRYYTQLTDITSADLQFNIDKIKAHIDHMKDSGHGNLLVKEYPPNTVTIETLNAHIEKVTSNLFVPDAIIVDYGDLLRPSHKYTDRRFELSGIFTDLRALSFTKKIPVITASQTNRSGYSSDIVGGDQISEDFGKVMIGDFVFSMARKIEDKINNTARIHIVKNRFGPDGFVYPAKFDPSIGELKIFDAASPAGQVLNKSMSSESNDKLTKKILKDTYFKGNK